ncbi:flagellar hook-basal body complex protein [uncultured Jannaschia sp.]|uniref:flagellar hook-basal body complex protein n=1 Tax=uncultured Jannaschia sp. TaxID=293347 RepID=UPI0026375D09|nr:flagellar hook-basal body complex protein [uncultured Jannaschia sp.]
MADGIYTTLGRQVGLLREMDVIAQNIANAATTGFRAEGLVFSEHVTKAPDGGPSVSFALADGRHVRREQGALEGTGGALDLAIEGDGYFLVDVGGTPHLTRAGAFVAAADGGIVTPEGHPVLDAGGAPVFVPPGTSDIHVGRDGTLSADGAPLAQIGVVRPDAPDAMRRGAGTTFVADGYVAVEAPSIQQGFLEASNVSPVMQIARMIAVQNAYEMGQGFMDREDQRMRSIMRLMDR